MKTLSSSTILIACWSPALLLLSASATAERKESQVAFRLRLLQRLAVTFLALLGLVALTAVVSVRPALAGAGSTVAVVQDDDGDDDDRGGDDDRDDDGASDDDRDDDGRDDDREGVRDVPVGGIDTGAGGTAAGAGGPSVPAAVPYVVGGGLLMAGAAALLRRVTGGAGS
jgi:hypothetical protein